MNFPASPTNGQTATVNNIVYTYNSANTTWTRTPGAIPFSSLTVSGTISSAGNITVGTGNFFIGDGSQLTGITTIVNGTSNVAVANNSNVTVAVTGNTIATFAATGLFVTGQVSSTGTVTAASTVGGVITGSSVSVTGGVTAASTVGGVITGSTASLTGNVTGGNILTGGLASITGNISGGNITVTGDATAQNFNTLSDAVVKTNIVPLASPHSIIDNLLGVEYDWTNGQGHSYGFVAQDVEKVLPEAVKTQNGLKSVNYTMIIPFLVETIKQLKTEVQELKQKIEKL